MKISKEVQFCSCCNRQIADELSGTIHSVQRQGYSKKIIVGTGVIRYRILRAS
jgi:hypothetical protein